MVGGKLRRGGALFGELMLSALISEQEARLSCQAVALATVGLRADENQRMKKRACKLEDIYESRHML